MLRRRRNTVAHWIANTALRLIATKDYRDMIDGAIRYGLKSAAEAADAEARLRAMTPEDWKKATPLVTPRRCGPWRDRGDGSYECEKCGDIDVPGSGPMGF